MQEILDKSHVLMQRYLINKNTRPNPDTDFIARQVHVVSSELGKTDDDVNDWIDKERGNIEKIVNITYVCFPSKNGVVKTKVFIDYERNTLEPEHFRTGIKVKETANLTELNGWLHSERDKIEVGGIRIVDLSAEMGSDDIAALIDYTAKPQK